MFDYNDSAAEELFDEEEDSALGDEDFYDQPKRTANQSGARGGAIDVAPEDSIAPSDREGEATDEAPRPSYPIDLDITISKPDKTSIEFVARATDGTIEIERLRYVSDPPADDDHTTPYAGPPFTNLDSDLSIMLEQYIAERGINEELAQMLPVIIEAKEQKEYVEWLQSECYRLQARTSANPILDMQNFISA
jgi:complement component 1 Q subcomponent-binding protein, mitochondrial